MTRTTATAIVVGLEEEVEGLVVGEDKPRTAGDNSNRTIANG
jgi:hypothetical protein